MERLAEEVARLARELEREVDDLRRALADSNGPSEATDSTERLGRMERRLEAIQGDTGELIRRVPGDLGELLAEMKRLLLLRLVESAGATESVDAGVVANDSPQTLPAPSMMVRSLTRQERRVFELCFQSGFLSYREIAEHLDITPSAAKNLVNRMLQLGRKRPLFAKQYKHGVARVGIRPDLKDRILKGPGSEEKQRRAEPQLVHR